MLKIYSIFNVEVSLNSKNCIQAEVTQRLVSV